MAFGFNCVGKSVALPRKKYSTKRMKVALLPSGGAYSEGAEAVTRSDDVSQAGPAAGESALLYSSSSLPSLW